MLHTARAAVLMALWCSASLPGFAAAEVTPGNATVGYKLQAPVNVRLSAAVQERDLPVTLTSDDPARLLLAKGPEDRGTPSIVVVVKAGYRESADFWVQGFGNSGVATYTANAPDLAPAKGSVTLTLSGIVIMGPHRGHSFFTTTGAEPPALTLYPVRLDAEKKYVEQQPVAGGAPIDVVISSSDPLIGKADASTVRIAGGAPTAVARFRPSAAGQTTLSLKLPPGFSQPSDHGSVTAVVTKPGMSLTNQVMIGQNLQLGGHVGLGEAAPPGGAVVTLTSEDPERLLLSTSATALGTKSITLSIPPGGIGAAYYLQALGSSGAVTYTASAPGYNSREATITLAPSGVVVTVSAYGPPDEAELLRKDAAEGMRGFVSNLSKREPMPLVVWTVQLDPVTRRSADITVQPLRAGLSVKVDLVNSNPAVGSVSSAVTIPGGSDHAGAHFTPAAAGSTVISAVTPAGFQTSANSTSVTAIVRD